MDALTCKRFKCHGGVACLKDFEQPFDEVAELMGCEYLYLFAADKTGDANLRNYYEASLKFKEDAEHGVGMPIYDWTCFLMSQPIANIKVLQDSFFSMIEESRDDWFTFDLT